MKLKNVLKGLRSRYGVEQVNVIAGDRVIFSGSWDSWDMTDVNMILYKQEVEGYEVIKSMVGGYCNRNAFLFVNDPENPETAPASSLREALVAISQQGATRTMFTMTRDNPANSPYPYEIRVAHSIESGRFYIRFDDGYLVAVGVEGALQVLSPINNGAFKIKMGGGCDE